MEIIATVVVQERRVDARVVTSVFEYELSIYEYTRSFTPATADSIL